MMLALKKGLEAGVKNSLERTDVLFFSHEDLNVAGGK